MTQTLFCFGLGYSALYIAEAVLAEGGKVYGTCRSVAKRAELENKGIRAVVYTGDRSEGDVSPLLADATHVLLSIPPDADGDIPLRHYRETLARSKRLQWVGYFSTTGVYGDHQGDWVDEDTPVAPVSERQRYRVLAEQQWLESGLPVHILRLAGIYGPRRNALVQLQEGTARRIYKEQQFFSRIHVEDIAQVTLASIAHPAPGEIYNVCDDLPAPAHEVVEYAAGLLGVTPPPMQHVHDADLSPMARSFYACSRRVKNTKLKQIPGISLRYPTYREGLQCLHASS